MGTDWIGSDRSCISSISYFGCGSDGKKNNLPYFCNSVLSALIRTDSKDEG